MAKKKQIPGLPRPTDAELELLQILWADGKLTVRQVHEQLPKTTSYNTTLTILQRMVEKGLVIRDESQRSHVYAAATAAEATQRQLLRHLLKSAFQGNAARLVRQALSEDRATDDELAELHTLVEEMQRRTEE